MLVGAVPAWQVPGLQHQERFLQAFGTQVANALNAASQDRGEIDRRIAAVKQEFQDSSRRVLHEVNNPLAIIKNYLGVLDDKLTRQLPVEGELALLNEEIDRVSSIMHEFVAGTPAQPAGKFEANRVLVNVARLFRESKFLPPGVQIVTLVPQEDSEVLGSGDTFKQILVNLIKNAVEAMPQGGRIEISNQGSVQRDGRSHFALCVKDDGPGIPQEQRSRIFSPVRSSKAGTNRGLGLSIVKELVNKLGGSIDCVSSSAGTCFDICLPAASAMHLPLHAPA
jgi:signal transduction histidine kinase